MTDFIRERVCLYSPLIKHNYTLDNLFFDAARYGVAGIELLSFYDELSRPSLKMAKDIKARARSMGLAIPCLSAGASLVGDSAEEDMARLYAYAEMCAEIEVPYLHHTIYMPFVKSEVRLPEDYIFERGVEAALELHEYAARLGVSTIVEDQGLIFNGVSGYGRLMDATGYKLGTVLDTGNIMFVDESAADFASRFAGNVKQVHIKDYLIIDESDTEGRDRYYETRGGGYIAPSEIGCGSVDFHAVSSVLDSVDYSGYFSIEFDKPEGYGEVERSLKFVDSVFG